MFPDVCISVSAEHKAPQPEGEVEGVEECHEHEEEPDEEEDPLVEQIDTQHTLHSHWLDRPHLPHLHNNIENLKQTFTNEQ